MLSIIVPVFNGERYLSQCLDSIINCGASEFEIIIVDDGSVDGSYEIAESYALGRENVSVFRHPGNSNRGVSASRNLGLANSTREFVSFLDSDDRVAPGRYKHAMAVLANDRNLDGVFDSVGVVIEDAGGVEKWVGNPMVFVPSSADSENGVVASVCSGEIKAFTQSLTLRRSILLRSGLFDEGRRLSEDYHFILRLVLSGRFICGDMKEPCVYYRRHSENTWNPTREDGFRDLGVLADVIRWGRGREWVDRDRLALVGVAFKRKLRYCFDDLRVNPDRRSAVEVVSTAVRVFPSLLLSRNFISNCVRCFVPGSHKR